MGIILLTVAFSVAVGTMVYAARPVTIIAASGRHIETGGWSIGLFVRVAIGLLLVAYCVKRVASSRYVVEIDERGILDGATRRPRISWQSIADLSCEMVGDAGVLVLVLEGPRRDEVRVDLDGINAPLQTVFSSAQDYWQSCRKSA